MLSRWVGDQISYARPVMRSIGPRRFEGDLEAVMCVQTRRVFSVRTRNSVTHRTGGHRSHE
jgi:hypothetical protein